MAWPDQTILGLARILSRAEKAGRTDATRFCWSPFAIIRSRAFCMFEQILIQSHGEHGVFAGEDQKFLCASVRKYEGFCRFCWILKNAWFVRTFS